MHEKITHQKVRAILNKAGLPMISTTDWLSAGFYAQNYGTISAQLKWRMPTAHWSSSTERKDEIALSNLRWLLHNLQVGCLALREAGYVVGIDKDSVVICHGEQSEEEFNAALYRKEKELEVEFQKIVAGIRGRLEEQVKEVQQEFERKQRDIRYKLEVLDAEKLRPQTP